MVNGIQQNKDYIQGGISHGEKEKFILENPTETRYGDIYGWDKGLIKFDNKNHKKENILVIGESFDNPIVELISNIYTISHIKMF